jgi:uncharacterized cupredoxin-like copper-binding protein
MRVKIFAAVALCAAVAAPLALAEGGVKTVRITESEWGIGGVPQTLKSGTKVHISVTNTGKLPHELVLEKANCAKQCAVLIAGHKAEIEHVKPGMTKSAVWTIAKPGKYTFTCRVPGHWMAGMRKTFTVS